MVIAAPSIDDYLVANSLPKPMGDSLHKRLIYELAERLPEELGYSDADIYFEVKYRNGGNACRSDLVIRTDGLIIVEGRVIRDHADLSTLGRYEEKVREVAHDLSKQLNGGGEFFRDFQEMCILLGFFRLTYQQDFDHFELNLNRD